MLIPRLLIVGLFALLFSEPVLASDSLPARRPNIVLIIGDDHGWPYAGFMGDDIVSTPNLDRLAAEGITFRHAFSSASVCRPALQTLLTGLHGRTWNAQRARIEQELGGPLRHRTEVPHYLTLPHQLRRQGYQSFQGGKLWEGAFPDAGFDSGTTYALSDGAIGTVGSLTFGRVNLNPLPEFLDTVGDRPFFLQLAPKLPHTPHDASAALRAPYEALGLTPSAVRYYANITRLDEFIGLILDELQARGLLETSLIIYVSDNGWEQAPYDEHFLGSILGGNRGKLSIHELGFRTPLIFSWPGRVPENQVVDDLVTFEDLHATMLEYAGAPISPDHKGVSLRGRIEGFDEPLRSHVIGVIDQVRVRESEFQPPISLFSVIRNETAAFLRTEQWRYVENLNRGERALYRIDQDPFEREDVAAEYPLMLEQFAARTAQWRDDLVAPASWMDLMGRLVNADVAIGSGLRLWLDGREVAGARVRLQVFTDARGYFRFPNVPAGEYELRYETEHTTTHPWSRNSKTESRSLNLTNYQTAPFLTLDVASTQPNAYSSPNEPGTIAIEVFDRFGRSITGLPLNVFGWTKEGRRQIRVSSGPDGFVVLDQLPAGFYWVSTRPDRRYRRTSSWVYLAPGTVRNLELEVRKPRRARNRWRSARK